MLVKLRYVTRRVDAKGGERWYWQRRGHPLTRLPADPAERLAMAERLNAAADSKNQVEPPRGSIKWVIKRYQDGKKYGRLANAGLKQRFGESRADLMAYGRTPWS